MRLRSLIFVVLVAGSLGASPSKAPIEESVKELVAQFTDGIAASYDKYLRIEFGKIFGSNREDAVALFAIEGFGGGNGHAEYLAFFESVKANETAHAKSRPYRLVAVTQIGGRGWRSFDGKIKLGRASVTVKDKRYGGEDAMCCPSVPIGVTFRIKNGIISEQK